MPDEGYGDIEELFRFLADPRTNEAATVERVRGRTRRAGEIATDGEGTR